MEIKLKLNGEDVVLNISDVTVNGKPVEIDINKQINAPKFKDGDFCYSTNGFSNYVFIFKSKIDSDRSNYHAILQLTNGSIFKINNWCFSYLEATRMASNEEKDLLLKALKENSLRWDEESKEILDLKWQPKLGDNSFCSACYILAVFFL